MPQFNLPSVIKRMHAKSLLHPLQHGRWVVSPGGVPTRTARLDELDVVADAVLRRLDIDHYLSWHSALWHYGLIDQQAPAHLRRGHRSANGQSGSACADVRFVTVNGAKVLRPRARRGVSSRPVWMATRREGASSTPSTSRASRRPLPVIANALRIGATATGILDPERLVADAIRFNSPHPQPPRWASSWTSTTSLEPTRSPLRLGRKFAVAPRAGPRARRRLASHRVNSPLARLRGPRASSATALELQMSDRAQSPPRSILEAARMDAHRPDPRAAARARGGQERNTSGTSRQHREYKDLLRAQGRHAARPTCTAARASPSRDADYTYLDPDEC